MVELAKDWRTDKILRRLEAMLLAVDAPARSSSPAREMHRARRRGNGHRLRRPHALAAARAMMAHTTLTAAQICQEAMTIAAWLWVYTNSEIVIEELWLWK